MGVNGSEGGGNGALGANAVQLSSGESKKASNCSGAEAQKLVAKCSDCICSLRALLEVCRFVR